MKTCFLLSLFFLFPGRYVPHDGYSVKHDCKNIVLLYPEHLSINTPELPYSIFFKKEEVKLHIKTIPLDIDLRRDQQLLVEKLKPICNLIYS